VVCQAAGPADACGIHRALTPFDKGADGCCHGQPPQPLPRGTVSRLIRSEWRHKVGVAGHYLNAGYDLEKREALELWAAHLMGLPSSSRQTASGNSDETSGQLAKLTSIVQSC
jgi:hypothetical protein